MKTGDNQHGETIRGLYTELAVHPAGDFAWGKGKENARALGYDAAWLEHFPARVWESSAAVGETADVVGLSRLYSQFATITCSEQDAALGIISSKKSKSTELCDDLACSCHET